MLNNLKAEMVRRGVTASDIQRLLGCTERTVLNKIAERTEFSVGEALLVRDTYFPGQKVETLFVADPANSANRE